MTKWNVYTLDVWGNAEDGWEVNDRFKVGTVEFSDSTTNREIWNLLKESGIARGRFKDAQIEGYGDGLIAIDDAKDGKPVFQLEVVDP